MIISRLMTFLAIVLACASQHAAHAQSQSKASPSLIVGAILPLTGSSAAFGAASQRGILMALEDLSPTDKSRVKVIFEDDGLNNARSITAAQKLINIDKVDALITWSSGTALAVGSLSETRKIPQLAIASDPAIAREHRYSFNYWPIPETETKTLYDYLKARGKRRVAMVTQINSFPLAMRDAFVANVTADNSLEIVADEEVGADATDMRSSLLKIKSKGALDGVIVASFPGQLAIIVKQLREIGITAPLFGYETFEDKASFEASAGLLTGAIYSTGADARSDFLERFRAKYPGDTDYTASHSYDSLRLLVDATWRQKDGESIAVFFRTLKDYPASSGVISATGDNRFTLPTTLKTLDHLGNSHSVVE